MREMPAGRMLGLSGTLFVCVLIASGCNSISLLQPKSSSETGVDVASRSVIRTGMELEWACQTSVAQAGAVRSGKSVVGPDGAIVLGPYGACRVAGLTLEQAGTRADKQLAAYLKQPRVTFAPIVRVQALAPASGEIVWKKAAPGDTLAKDWFSGKDQPIRPATGTYPQPLPKDGVPKSKESAPLPKKDEIWVAPYPQPVGPSLGFPVMTQSPIGRPIKHQQGPPIMPVPQGPNEMHRMTLPEYVIRPPDVLVIETMKGLQIETAKGAAPLQPVRGPHLVRPDGTVSIGIYGPAAVSGKTVDEARKEIAKAIFARLDQTKPELEKNVYDNLSVDVLAYNSSVYYVITDGAGLGEQVYRFPVTGNETVLDAISLINGLPVMSSPRRIWVARRTPGLAADNIYPVDWKGIAMQGAMATNWQIMPGDRVYVQADPVRRFNNNLQKFLEPVERIMGGILLGSQAANSIRSGSPTVIGR